MAEMMTMRFWVLLRAGLATGMAFALCAGQAGCQSGGPATAQGSENGDSARNGSPESSDALAPFAVTESGSSVDLSQLRVGDRVVFQIPDPEPGTGVNTSDFRTIGTSNCVCAWSVDPVASGSFSPPRACETTYTALRPGDMIIRVTQSCSGQEPRDFAQRITAIDTSDEGDGNRAPVVTIDARVVVDEGSLVTLDGAGSFDPDGDAVTYEWLQIDGLKVTLRDADSARASFTAPEVDVDEALTFMLIVSDGRFSSLAEVTVTVANLAEAAGFVRANAGPDISVDEGDVVVLDGTGSSGISPGALTFAWRQIGGSPVAIDDSDKAVATFVAPPVPPSGMLLRFQLTVVERDLQDETEVNVNVADVPGAVDVGGGGGGSGGESGASGGETIEPPGPVCGNGVVESGEVCDGGGATSTCDANCSSATCGDGTLNTQAGEECDDGNLVCGDGCGAGCEVEDEESHGACCRGTGSCLMVTLEAQCVFLGGTFLGNGTSCCDAVCPNTAPRVFDVTATTQVNGSVQITLTGSDPGAGIGGQQLSFSVVTHPCHGSLGTIVNTSPTTARVTYTPELGFQGVDRFTFSASDGEALSEEGLGEIAVGGPKPLRFIWGSSSDSIVTEGHLGRMLEDGVTDPAIKLPSLGDPIGQADSGRLETWSEALAGEEARLWIIYNWFAWNEQVYFADHGMTWEVYVTPAGVPLPNTPCPTSQSFWDFAVTGRSLAILRAADPSDPSYIEGFDGVLEGIIIDPELYSSEIGGYDDPCYCNVCFANFLDWLGDDNPLGPGEPIPSASERFDFLVDNSTPGLDLVAAYGEHEESVIFDRTTAYRESVHAVNPCIKLGSTASVRDDPFYLGFARGLGSRRAPYYELSQRFLNSGFTPSVDMHLNDIANLGIYAELIVGMSFRHFTPEGFADHYYSSATQTSGAWLNRMDAYENDGSGLCHDFDEYRQAVSDGSVELDAFEQNPNHVSGFTGAPFAPGCVESAVYVPPTPLVPVDGTGETVAEGPWVRRETAYYFYVDVNANPNLSFDLWFRRFGVADQTNGWWALAAPDGEVLLSEPLSNANDVNNSQGVPSELRYTATESGLYFIIANTASIHGFNIADASHPGSYRRAPGVGSVGFFKAHELDSPVLYGYVPPGVTNVQVRLFASSGEPTLMQIYDERANLTPAQALFNAVIGPSTGTVNLVLPLGNPVGGGGVVLEAHFINPPPNFGAEDVDIEFISGALPYLSQTRSGLLRAP